MCAAGQLALRGLQIAHLLFDSTIFLLWRRQPGRGENMGSGWETARNPRRPPVLETDPKTGFVNMPGVSDWSVLRLAAVGESIESLTIDTQYVCLWWCLQCRFVECDVQRDACAHLLPCGCCSFYRGNYPESVVVESCYAPDATAQQASSFCALFIDLHLLIRWCYLLPQLMDASMKWEEVAGQHAVDVPRPINTHSAPTMHLAAPS